MKILNRVAVCLNKHLRSIPLKREIILAVIFFFFFAGRVTVNE